MTILDRLSNLLKPNTDNRTKQNEQARKHMEQEPWRLEALKKYAEAPRFIFAESGLRIDHGNHSCGDCCANFKCPICKQTDAPNTCSYYLPPSNPNYPVANGYWAELEDIKWARINNGRPARGW